MKNCVCRYIRKHREIKGSDKYVTLEIWLKSNGLNKMKITSSESKDNPVRLVKGLITSLDIKGKVRPQKYKRHAMPSEMSVKYY